LDITSSATESDSSDQELVIAREFESTITTRGGQYSKRTLEYDVMPCYKLPRLSLDVMAKEDLDLDLVSDNSFDSDLDVHVENFAPSFNALKNRDKQYLIANVKHMLDPDMATSTPNMPYRPKSPEHFKSLTTRSREKEELRDLNERLLVYVNHMRSLKEIEETETHVQVDGELTKIQDSLKELFHVELEEARRLLDETANQKAALELENGRTLDNYAQLRAELDEKEKEIEQLKALIEELEKKLANSLGDIKELKSDNKRMQKENDDLKRQLTDEQNNRKVSEKEIVRLERVITNYEGDISKLRQQLKDFASKEKNLKSELKNLRKNLEELKDELDKETLKRIDIENKTQTLREEMEFKNSLKEKELMELRRETSSVHRIKIRKREAAEEFAVQLSEALSKAREHFEEEKLALREQLINVHKQELKAARCLASTHTTTKVVDHSRELISTRAEIEKLKLTIDAMLAQEKNLQKRIKALEDLLERAEKAATETEARHQINIEKLEKQLQALLKDYSDLMDVKVTLDMEIAAYRKLLMAEENRLNLTPSPKSGKVRSALSFNDGDAPSRKRQRVMEESFTTETNSHVSIEEVNIDDEYVGITNMTDKDQSMKGWVIAKICGDEKLEYKFPAKAIVGPGQVLKVYSAGSGATHNPPLSLVFKKLDAWSNTSDLEIQLKNADGEVVSTYKAKAETSTEYLEEGDQRACSLM